ncbi:MAG: undecaprenyldiphospho-muramoylpentapeptide beta-N-acetylglucosaminyltransferase [Clostridiales bacterium]|nr:MAG: undecaprenyldiphospho-muramoylpentapeptide beta-N-acetylglucosaminyltransferase [Clostridiales bacterium]
MRLIISGGGTGGHIYPAIALYRKLKTAIPDCDTLYIGSENGQEHLFVNDDTISYKEISVMGFDRRNMKTWGKSIWKLFKSFWQTFNIMRKYKPDLVIGTGGYVTGPVILVAHILGVDTMIHEQNHIPGFTTKFLSNFADRVLISYKESIPYFKKQNRLYFTGNPVREEFVNVDRLASREKLGIKEDEFLVITMAGSNGATKFNEISIYLDELVSKDAKLKYIHIIGKYAVKEFQKKYGKHEYSDRTTLLEYSENMPELMAAADLMICRSGAITLAEMSVIGLPGILIPSPNVANDHQRYNAMSFAKEGSCIMLEEAYLDKKSLTDSVKNILYTDNTLAIMRNKYNSDFKENALGAIVSLVYDYHLR